MLQIILNAVRSCFRSGTTIFFSILFPSLCAFFLGTLLENIEVSDDVVGEINLAYRVENGDYSGRAFEEFILSLDEENVINAEKISADELENAAEKYSAAVELNGSEIAVYNGKNAVQNRTVKALMDGYNQNAAAFMTVAEKNPQALANIEITNESFVEPKDFGRTRTMMDYYAVSMTVVIIFFGAMISGAEAYHEEYARKTINRLNISPVSHTKIYFGKIIGHLPLVFVQVGTVMIVSAAFFGARFCASFGENLLLFAMFICASLATLAFGVCINLLFPKMQSWAVLMPINWVMLFFSGTFQADIAIKGVSEYLPPNIIMEAAFDLTVFGRMERALEASLWSLVIFAALMLIGWIKVNTRRKNA